MAAGRFLSIALGAAQVLTQGQAPDSKTDPHKEGADLQKVETCVANAVYENAVAVNGPDGGKYSDYWAGHINGNENPYKHFDAHGDTRQTRVSVTADIITETAGPHHHLKTPIGGQRLAVGAFVDSAKGGSGAGSSIYVEDMNKPAKTELGETNGGDTDADKALAKTTAAKTMKEVQACMASSGQPVLKAKFQGYKP